MCLFVFRFARFLFVMLFLQFDSSSSSNSSSSATRCPPKQSRALLLFKQSFSIYSSASTVLWSLDDSYPKTESWKKGKDCCLWDGVTCDVETGYTVGLNLSYSMLYGSITSDNSLFSLSHLRSLDLSHNHFKNSPISSRFGFLFNLVHLNLNSARFSGSVPSQISQLSRLVSLDLSGNELMTLETDTFDSLVRNLNNLRELNFNGVDMSMVAGLPKSLMNLTSSLSTLKLGSCGLSGPEFFNYLPNSLISLDLSDNNLKLDVTSFRSSFQNLSSLRELEMRYVNLSSFSLMSLPSSLSALILSSCGLRGQFPEIFHLSGLVSLDLSENNELTIDTAAFRKIATSLSYLEQVDMSQVNMSLVQPVYFQNLSSSLSRLYLNYCGLRGEFPAILLQQPNLKKLALRGNEDLNGSLFRIPTGVVPSNYWIFLPRKSQYCYSLLSSTISSR
ncbi:receptor like protein 30 [Euphorbia peplus]|nr:receptor like protein 30 [Euphorbia peplus]